MFGSPETLPDLHLSNTKIHVMLKMRFVGLTERAYAGIVLEWKCLQVVPDNNLVVVEVAVVEAVETIVVMEEMITIHRGVVEVTDLVHVLQNVMHLVQEAPLQDITVKIREKDDNFSEFRCRGFPCSFNVSHLASSPMTSSMNCWLIYLFFFFRHKEFIDHFY